MNVNQTDRIALVTGASSGLGKRFAECLAEAGITVALAARRTDRLSEVEKKINGNGGHAITLGMDVRDSNSVNKGIDEVISRLGGVDILINNAGISIEKYISDTSEDDYEKIIGTNLKGAWLVARAVGLYMIKSKVRGKIINIASVLGSNVIPMLSLYSMSKGGVIQMTKAMALEWARYNIQVNAIAPGFIETEMNQVYFQTDAGQEQISRWPGKRLGAPSDLDGVLLLLTGQNSDFITGTVVTVDDGQVLKGL